MLRKIKNVILPLDRKLMRVNMKAKLNMNKKKLK